MSVSKATTAPVRTIKPATTASAASTPSDSKPTLAVQDGKITANINGKKVTINDSNIQPFSKAFVLDGGKTVAYAGRDGAGGFEGEGQSLRLYDVASGKSTKVLSSSFMIDNVRSAKTPDGKSALLVDQSDGGLGGNHFSIVDPKRGGEVFQQKGLARFESQKGDLLKLALFNEASYSSEKPRPIGYKAVSLTQALSGPLIENRNSEP